MVRRSPCERYIKYLISHTDKYNNGDIKKLLEAQQLDYIGEAYINNLRFSCIPPIPFYPNDIAHLPSQRFLRKEEISEIYYCDENMRVANSLLENARAKEIIEALLITRAVPAWICAALKKNQIRATVDSIKYYRWFYFDLTMVDENELRQIMDIRAIPEPTADPTEQKLNSTLVKASKMDSRFILSRMAITPLAGLNTVMRMGVIPRNLNVSRIAKAARDLAVSNAYDCVAQKQTEMARDLAIVAKMMGEVLEQIGEVQEDLQAGLSRIALATDNRPVPNLKEISGGEHTLDIAPIEQIQVMDEEFEEEGPTIDAEYIEDESAESIER